MATYVLVKKFCEVTGYTDDAGRAKIHRGDWLEGRVWVKAPDGRIMISMEGFTAWVERTTQLAAKVDKRPAN